MPSSSSLKWDFTGINDKNFTIKGRTLLFITVVFSSVFLILLVYLIAQRFCRPSNNTNSNSILPSRGTAPTLPACRGLDKASIRALPVTLHRQQSEAECCICLAVFENGDKVKVLPHCHHCYHDHCVDQWLTTHSNCPLCRTSIRVA